MITFRGGSGNQLEANERLLERRRKREARKQRLRKGDRETHRSVL